VAATCLLVAAFPLLVLTAALLALMQGRPIFYRQRRIGLHGHPFTLLKFRTMVEAPPAIRPDLPVAKIQEEARVTPLGQLLRRFAVDELPQLWNVLRGDMSMVGPRPLPQADLDAPGWLTDVPHAERARRRAWQSARHTVLPGLTGRWQITPQPPDDFDNWIASDLAYIAHLSAWQDLQILALTPFAVLRGRRRASAARRQVTTDTV
jgi:lipopolysaccharide/colanic/teichoic acid biosynthesis glycosyltransferase